MKKHGALLKFLFPAVMIVLLLMLSACGCEQTGTSVQDAENLRKECFSCFFFSLIYGQVGKLTNELYPIMCDFALSLLAICLFAWILIHVLKLITTMREPNIAQFWVSFIQMLFKCIFVAAFIGIKKGKGIVYLVETLLTPIASVILATAADILDTNWISAISKNQQYRIEEAPGFSEDIGLQLEDLIYRIQLALSNGRLMGLKLMREPSYDTADWFMGVLLVFIFMMLTIFYPFYLIDGIVRLAFALGMLPIFLVCWCFKVTSAYVQKAFSIFLGAFLQILMGCIFVALAVAVFEGFINLHDMNYMTDNYVETADASFDAMAYREAESMSISFLSFVFLAFYIYVLSKRINQFSAFFSGAPGASMMGAWIARIKAIARATVQSAIAVTASLAGMGAVAKVASEHAKENLEEARRGEE